MPHAPLLTAIAAQAINTSGQAKPQELSNTAWAYAPLPFLHLPLCDAIAAASIAKIAECVSQDISNLAWAFATLHLPHAPLCDALAAPALAKIRYFDRQHLVNTAWSFATLRVENPPLMAAISSSSLPKLGQVLPHGQASLAWALARLASPDAPLFDAIAASALSLLGGKVPRLAGRNVGMLLWAFSRSGHLPHVWRTLEASKAAGQHLDGLSLSGIAQACRELALHQAEVRLLQQHMSRGAMGAVALDAAAMLLAEVGAAEEALPLLRAGAEAGLFGRVSLRIWVACGGGASDIEPMESLRVERGEPYSKELRVLSHVLSAAAPGDAASVCGAVESFGEGKLPGTSHWLKIAGGAKADLLAACARRAPRRGVFLEVGTYCGFSAARLVAAAAAVGRRPRRPLVVSLEVDAAHAIIARSLLAFAGVAHQVEVLTGHSEDVLPWLIGRMEERFGPGAFVDMVFLDQRGSRYEADLDTLERAGALSPGAVVVADNVLKPGAPLFLWRVTHGSYATEVFTMQEFAMSGVEDWMTVSVYQPDHGKTAAADPPDQLRVLDWKAERMRARAHQPDHGGSGVGFAEWADFAAEMRQGLAEAGFEAEPL